MADVRVIVAEDHTIVRKGLTSLLEAEPGFEVVSEAANGREALQLAEQLRPDVVLMDISMPGLNGLEATRQIRKQFPEMRSRFSMYSSEEYIFQALHAGASGYLLKMRCHRTSNSHSGRPEWRLIPQSIHFEYCDFGIHTER